MRLQRVHNLLYGLLIISVLITGGRQVAGQEEVKVVEAEGVISKVTLSEPSPLTRD